MTRAWVMICSCFSERKYYLWEYSLLRLRLDSFFTAHICSARAAQVRIEPDEGPVRHAVHPDARVQPPGWPEARGRRDAVDRDRKECAIQGRSDAALSLTPGAAKISKPLQILPTCFTSVGQELFPRTRSCAWSCSSVYVGCLCSPVAQ